MSKTYGFENVIIDPDNEDVRSAVGKEVYAGTFPIMLIENAKYGIGKGILTRIEPHSGQPFVVSDSNNKEHSFPVVIICQKDIDIIKPFDTVEEFLEAYRYTSTDMKYSKYYNEKYKEHLDSGIVLKGRNNSIIFSITQINCDGLQIKDYPYYVTWDIAVKSFCFIDGSPCGKPFAQK